MLESTCITPLAANVRAAIRLDFRPEVGLISRTSRFVRDFFGTVLADPDATSRVMLTTYELLENTAKHSVDGYGHLQVELIERGEQSFVRVRSRNRARPEQLARLRRCIDQLAAAEDPVALYQRIITDAAGSPGAPDEPGGIGLARVCAEAEMQLSCTVEADEVAICAETPVEVKAPRR
jgi:two-component sensor histidine kinase